MIPKHSISMKSIGCREGFADSIDKALDQPTLLILQTQLLQPFGRYRIQSEGKSRQASSNRSRGIRVIAKADRPTNGIRVVLRVMNGFPRRTQAINDVSSSLAIREFNYTSQFILIRPSESGFPGVDLVG